MFLFVSSIMEDEKKRKDVDRQMRIPLRARRTVVGIQKFPPALGEGDVLPRHSFDPVYGLGKSGSNTLPGF